LAHRIVARTTISPRVSGRRTVMDSKGEFHLKRKLLVVSFAILILALSATPAFAHTPWPDNGMINPITRTYVLEYGQAPYTTTPVIHADGGFPSTVHVTLGSASYNIDTAAEANALLMAPRTTNAAFSADIPFKGLSISGNLQVRHGLLLYKPYRTSTKYTARGKVLPGGIHSVSVALQKQYFGVWITRQKMTVKTNTSGNFSAAFYGRYSGKYRVRGIVASDANNIIQTSYRIY
jgi:hypothetical protein